MGLFDFVKEAGAKMFDDNKPADSETITVSPERLNELRAANILKLIGATEIQVAGLEVVVENGDKAILRGKVATQADCEKLVLTAGNQFGIASVDCQIEVETPQNESRFYTVKSGDSLSRIAKEMYGSGAKYPVIFEANRPMLSDPDKIYPGQVLRIPEADMA